MPSIVTHHLFAKDVLTKNKNININQNVYYIFTQSFDNLFYYNFFMPFLGNKIKKLGRNAQKQNVNKYFKNIIQYIKNNNLTTNEDLLAYLYGSYCHYVLDSYCHPYIIYNTGAIENNIKYRGNHEQMETMIDAILYKEKTGNDLKNAKLANILLPKIKFSNELKNCLNNVFFKTFKINNIGPIYEKSYKTGNFILKYFVTDKTGIKKQIYKIKDIFGNGKKYQHLSFHISKLNMEVLNENHLNWLNPANKNIIKNNSFKELYEKALLKVNNIIVQTELYFKNKISLNTLLNIIGNNSYVTGLDCNNFNSLLYFKI